jgi:hypothetical protein
MCIDDSFMYTVLNARSIFRKQVWLQGAYARHAMLPCDASDALQKTNWNIVELARVAAAGNEGGGSAVGIVMLSIDMAMPSTNGSIARIDWSKDAISDIVDEATVYGDISPSSQIIVQICFKGLRSHSFSANKAVAVVVSDNTGMAYGYNLPENPAGSVAYKCVSKVLLNFTGSEPSMIVNVVKYTPRTLYDEYLYAMYITAACGEIVRAHVVSRSVDSSVERSTCRLSATSTSPTRVIANIRFLMFLQGTGNTEDLLLDERNSLDVVSRITQGVATLVV